MLHREFWTPGEDILGELRRDLPYFSEIVRPDHTLVFPYPSQGLPRIDAIGNDLGEIHANRRLRAPENLPAQDNPPAPHILKIGRECHEIEAAKQDA